MKILSFSLIDNLFISAVKLVRNFIKSFVFVILTENYSACTICKAPISSIVLCDGSSIPIEVRYARYDPDPAEEALAVQALIDMDMDPLNLSHAYVDL